MDNAKEADVSLSAGEVFYILYIGQKLDPVILAKFWLKCKEWFNKEIISSIENIDITNFIYSIITMCMVNDKITELENKKGYIAVLEAMVMKFIYKESENVG